MIHTHTHTFISSSFFAVFLFLPYTCREGPNRDWGVFIWNLTIRKFLWETPTLTFLKHTCKDTHVVKFFSSEWNWIFFTSLLPTVTWRRSFVLQLKAYHSSTLRFQSETCTVYYTSSLKPRRDLHNRPTVTCPGDGAEHSRLCPSFHDFAWQAFEQ